MDLNELKQVLEIMQEHDLAELELERPDLKVRIRKQAAGHPVAVTAAAPMVLPAPVAAPAAAPAGEPVAEDGDLAILKSPIVGTFYRAPEPGAPAFVEVGARVRKGQPLCIIEAMKLMNEITSDVDGEVVKVYADNAQAVQYGERLFAIRPGS